MSKVEWGLSEDVKDRFNDVLGNKSRIIVKFLLLWVLGESRCD